MGNTEESKRRTTLLSNAQNLYWTADEAKSKECFEKKELCFVEQSFADRLTAVKYLEARFGGVVYSPGNEPETINPV
jgi:hypothetical protein